MRGAVIFVAGLVCGLAVQTMLAQSGDAANTAGVVLNHVGLSVPSIPEAAAFYKEKMGFKLLRCPRCRALRQAVSSRGSWYCPTCGTLLQAGSEQTGR